MQSIHLIVDPIHLHYIVLHLLVSPMLPNVVQTTKVEVIHLTPALLAVIPPIVD